MALTKYPQSLVKSSSVSKTANYTAVETDDIIYCDSSGGAFTITLPAAATFSGKQLQIIKTDSTFATANAITIDGNASETINGSTTTLNTQYEALKIVSNGTNWIILERFIPSVCTSYSMTIGATTTAPTKGTVSYDSAHWSRVGDRARIKYQYYQTAGGSAGTGTYLFPIPTGLVIDTAKMDTAGNPGFPCGNAFLNNGGLYYLTEIYPYNTTNLALLTNISNGGSGDYVGSTAASLNTASIRYGFVVEVPITGWNG